jgi:hypothetical protein
MPRPRLPGRDIAQYASTVGLTDAAAERALRRLLEADDTKDEGVGDDSWTAWQRAATDYWVLLHPDLATCRDARVLLPGAFLRHSCTSVAWNRQDLHELRSVHARMLESRA